MDNNNLHFQNKLPSASNGMNVGRILFFGFLLIYSSIILTTTGLISNTNYYQKNRPAYQISMIERQKQLIDGYQNSLNQILINYNSADSNLDSLQRLEQLEKDFLELTVPAELKDLHFNLLQAVLQARANTGESISQSRSLLEQMIKNYSWLASNLSLFIINNY